MSHPWGIVGWLLMFLVMNAYCAWRPGIVIAAKNALLQNGPTTRQTRVVQRVFAAMTVAGFVDFGWCTDELATGLGVGGAYACLTLLGEVARWRHWPPYVAVRTLGAALVLAAAISSAVGDARFRLVVAVFGLLMLLAPGSWARGPFYTLSSRAELVQTRLVGILGTLFATAASLFIACQALAS